MYPSDTMIEFVGLEEELAMGHIAEPLTDADMEYSAPTDDLFGGINELLFSLLSRLPSGIEVAMLQSLFYMVSQLENRHKKQTSNSIFSSLKPVKI